jgi:geranylgeranyl diphosphate synthase type II
MVGGQVQDMLSEGAEPDAEVLQYIHRHKTGALLAASVKMGAILHGTDEQTMAALKLYGEAIGLAFQVVDDILDIRGDEAEIGKPVGSDLEKHKLTYPAVYGMDESMRRAAELVDEALHALEGMDERAEPLREIARYLLRRTS